MLQVDHIGYTYQRKMPLERIALVDVSFAVATGECLAIVGVSGSGKSTLARIIAGLATPSTGSVLLEGADITARSPLNVWRMRLARLRRPPAKHEHPRRPVLLAFQNPEDQFFATSVLAEVSDGLAGDQGHLMAAFGDAIVVHKRGGRVQLPAAWGDRPPAPAALEALRRVELDPNIYGRRDPFTLSGGEQRRLALAVLLAHEPRVLVLDEPSAGLDEPGRRRLYDCLERARREQGVTVILISHDLDEVATIAQRTVVLSGGRIALDGPTRLILERGRDLEAAGLVAPDLVQLRQSLADLGHVFPGAWTDPAHVVRDLEPALGLLPCRPD